MKGAATRIRIRPPGYGRTLVLITAAGAVLRLLLMARQPLGYDEDFTAVVVHQPTGRMLDILAHDSAPPLFYLAERGVVVVATPVSDPVRAVDAFLAGRVLSASDGCNHDHSDLGDEADDHTGHSCNCHG